MFLMVEMTPRSSGKIELAVLGFIIHIKIMNIVKYNRMKSRLLFNDINVMIGQNPRALCCVRVMYLVIYI